MANISHVELGRTLIATIFMCLSTREKPINVFAYYVCLVQVLHILSANRCTCGSRKKRHLFFNVHTNVFAAIVFLFILQIRASEI